MLQRQGWKTFSKVSALVHLLWIHTLEGTFQNLCLVSWAAEEVEVTGVPRAAGLSEEAGRGRRRKSSKFSSILRAPFVSRNLAVPRLDIARARTHTHTHLPMDTRERKRERLTQIVGSRHGDCAPYNLLRKRAEFWLRSRGTSGQGQEGRIKGDAHPWERREAVDASRDLSASRLRSSSL